MNKRHDLTRPELALAFEAWLADHFEPYRTRSGAFARRGDLLDYGYHVHESLRIYLGGVYPAHTLLELRRANRVPYIVRKAVAELVTHTPAELYALRVEQAIEMGFSREYAERTYKPLLQAEK